MSVIAPKMESVAEQWRDHGFDGFSAGNLRDADGNIYWGFPDNRQGRRQAERAHGHPIQRLTREQAEKLASREEVISGGAVANLYVRKTGSDANGGSSTGASPDRTGTDGVANGTTTFTSATAAFVAGDVDKLINIVGKGRYRILTINSGTSVLLSGSPTAGSGLTWNIGGAVLTVGALLQAAAGTIINGDAVWIGAGVYRETISCTNTNTAEVTINGDFDGAKTGDVGMVQISAYLTNDKTAASATTLLNLNTKDFLTFKNIMFVGGAASLVTAAVTSTDIKFTDCCLYTTRNNVGVTANCAFNTPFNWTVDRCILVSTTGTSVFFQIGCTTAGAGADYDANFNIKNTLHLGIGTFVSVAPIGSSTSKGNGVHLRNVASFTGTTWFTSNSGTLSNTVANTIYNCFVSSGAATCVAANAAGGLITENYNLFATSGTVRSNVTAGANSISDLSYAPLFHAGQERIWGGLIRSFMEPMASSPLLGFGTGTGLSAYDLRNRIRPAGGASALAAVGALERGNTFITDPSPIGAGGSAIKTTGPSYAEFLVPVPARPITISCTVKWDATYAGTKPQLQIDANGRIGVAAETKTAVGGSGSNETLTLSAFTPSAAGQMVTVRVISNDTNGGGVLQVDNFTVSG